MKINREIVTAYRPTITSQNRGQVEITSSELRNLHKTLNVIIDFFVT